MDIFVDTSVIIPFLIETPATREVRDFFDNHYGTLHTCSMVFQETLFIGLRLIAVERLQIRSYHDLRNYTTDYGFSFAEDFFVRVYDFFGQIQIHPDSADYLEIMRLISDYHLFPADAVIATTCIEQKIAFFASRDKDFSRVKCLKQYNFQ